MIRCGWGLLFDGRIKKGTWPQAVRTAIEKRCLSISHLQLASVILLMDLRINKRNHLPEHAFIFQNDAEIAVMAANMLRASNTVMLKIVQKLVQVMEDDRETYIFVHTLGKRNGIADALSRRELPKAKEMAIKLFGEVSVVDPSPRMLEIERFIGLVAKQSLKKIWASSA